MSRPWRDKYPLCSLRGDGDDERFEAFSAWQPAALRRRPAPDRDGAEVDRRHRAKQLALARRAARRERRRLAGSALVAQPTGMVREPSAHGGHNRSGQLKQRRTDAGQQAEQRHQSQWDGRSSSSALDGGTASRKRRTHTTAGDTERTVGGLTLQGGSHDGLSCRWPPWFVAAGAAGAGAAKRHGSPGGGADRAGDGAADGGG